MITSSRAVTRSHPHQCNQPRKPPKDSQNRRSIAKNREEDILKRKREGKAETRSGAKWTGGTVCCREECHERGKRRVPDPPSKHPRPKEAAEKQEGHNLASSYNPVNTWNLKNQWTQFWQSQEGNRKLSPNS